MLSSKIGLASRGQCNFEGSVLSEKFIMNDSAALFLSTDQSGVGNVLPVKHGEQIPHRYRGGGGRGRVILHYSVGTKDDDFVPMYRTNEVIVI